MKVWGRYWEKLSTFFEMGVEAEEAMERKQGRRRRKRGMEGRRKGTVRR